MNRYIWTILAMGLLLAACTGKPGSGEQETSGPPDATGLVEVVLEVEGMTCEGCEKAINAGVESLNGVEGSESSHQEKWTRVTYDPEQITLDEIESKITETGYDVTGMKEEGTP